MSKPIEPTPILTGRDAERVWADFANTQHSVKKAKFLEECRRAFQSTK